MLEVWTLWFVGRASFSLRGCDNLHCSDRMSRFHTRRIRIRHQGHFFRVRIRHFRYSHPKQFSTNIHEEEDFLCDWNFQHDHSFRSKLTSFFRHSTTYIWRQVIQHGFFDCLWIGLKLQSFPFRLLSTILFCQVHLFAINWMISTSDRNHGWWEPKCPSSGRFSHVHCNIRFSPWKLHVKNGPTPWKVHYPSHDASNRVIRYFRHCAALWKKRCEFTPGKCSYCFEVGSNHNPFCGMRVGEAKNPGPEPHRGLDIGTFNPTQLLNKEDDVLQWGQGIYTACETSVTPVAHQVVNGKFRKAGWFSRWSQFVEPQQPKTSQIRGKAGGTAILSTYPLKPYMEPCPDILCNTDRFCEGVAQIHCNTNIYVSAMYGFPIANAYLNALQMNNSLFTPIAERALNFQGPAIITGDFNCDLKDLVAWKTLTNTGWWDAAQLDSFLYNRAPQPTCRESTRRSFVLVNSHLASRLIQCRTCDDFLFSSHPLLLANFDLETLIQPQQIWTLPKATDDLLFDSDAQNHQIEKDLNEWGDKFSDAITSKSPDYAAQLFARLVQNSWVASNVDVEGNPLPLQPGFLGRDRIKLIQKKHCSIPLIHKGRDGTFEPCCGQSSISIRRHTRQMRRLETLVLQVKSRQKTGNIGAEQKCQDLWDSIRNAKGFHKSFSWWIGSNLGWFVPEVCPHIEYLTSLKEKFYRWHNDELHRYYLHRRRMHKISVALDTTKGGRLAFRELKDPPLAPLTFLAQSSTSQVVKVKWPKQGLTQIKVSDGTLFDHCHPLHFQGQTCRIVRQSGVFIEVDPPLKLRNNDMKITQHNATADPDKLQDVLANAWNQHWTRDLPPQQYEDDWKDIGPILEHLPDMPEKAFTPFSLDVWNKHCKGLNKRSSRGGCGFSVIEMVSFPPLIVQQLFRIFEACEHGMPWPSSWVTAKVCMLSKCENPKSPFDARPITVFGVLYRQWSRIRSREILAYMASFMPVELAAATNGISADTVACLITHIAETAINKGESVCGIGIDLTRCFNTLPRHPLILALRKLGVPEVYIQAWSAMLSGMTRTLTISNSQGPLLSSTTGTPEGCGMSVAAMACITFWCGRYILDQVPVARPICYADNWNILTQIPRDLMQSIESIQFFVEKLRLAINPKKSWLWATRASHRKNLQGTRIGNDILPVVCNTSDLGCDLHYSRRVRKPQSNKRWAKAKLVCSRITKSNAPKGFRRRLAKGAGMPAANFGISLQSIPKTQWKILRTAISRAIGYCGAGASPWLTLASCNLDPQLGNIITVCKFWRRFLRSFPQQVPHLVSNLMRVGISKVGPVANFRKTLNLVGWNFIDEFTMHHQDSGTSLQWRTCSNKHLAFVLQKCWPWSVVAKSPERKDWDRSVFDIPMYTKLVSPRDIREAAILQGFTSGKHFTNDLISKYDKNITPKCPFCESLDSKHHRLFVCTKFKHIRIKFSKAIKWAAKQKGSLKYFGLPIMQPTIWDNIKAICAKDVTWKHPPHNHEPWYLFLDGSAFGQTRRETTLSSWAVVKSDHMATNFEAIASGFTPTWEHSSFRGEVAAVLMALQLAQTCHLYSDCQAVVDTVLSFLEALRDHKPFPVVDHHDLWFPIWELLRCRPSNTVTITKVTAHQDASQIADVRLRWYALGNNYVDVQAKRVITTHPVYRRLQKLEKQYISEFALHRDYHSFVCALTEETYNFQPKKTKTTHDEDVNTPDFFSWGPQTNVFTFELPAYESLPTGCPFGATFYNRVRDWFRKLQWPKNPVAVQPVQFIGLVELYFDFVLISGTESPINVAKRPQTSWKLLDENLLLQSPPVPLARHTDAWFRFWKWCTKYSGASLPFSWVDRAALKHVGYTVMATCVHPRPRLADTKSSQAIWNYFHQITGRRRDMSHPLRPLPQP